MKEVSCAESHVVFGCSSHVFQGHRVGSEFWSVPQHYGDEMSGITATLTQTERGNRPAVTRVAQPLSTRLESGTHSHTNMINTSLSHTVFPYTAYEERGVMFVCVCR